jgi:hypothetical protein
LNKRASVAESGLNEVQSPACPLISFEKHGFCLIFGYLRVTDLLFEGGGVGASLFEVVLKPNDFVCALTGYPLRFISLMLNLRKPFHCLRHGD